MYNDNRKCIDCCDEIIFNSVTVCLGYFLFNKYHYYIFEYTVAYIYDVAIESDKV